MKTFLPIVLIFSVLQLNGQTTWVKAEKGDGIFSILRKQGLDPVKYYSEFVTLNKDNLKNGSELYLGREYQIPNAPDSFKKMAVELETETRLENAIFNEKELSTVTSKSKRLSNAVIYLLPSDNESESSKEMEYLKKQIMQRLASQLMVHGAKIYLLEAELQETKAMASNTNEQDAFSENPIANQEQLQQYVDIINQRYLKNSGKYQRVLVIHLSDALTTGKYFDLSIYHHNTSAKGEHFAKNLQQIFKQNSRSDQKSEYTGVFKNSRNLFLAKNVVPPITMITITNSKSATKKDGISIRKNEGALTRYITSGVLKDYAELTVEEYE